MLNLILCHAAYGPDISLFLDITYYSFSNKLISLQIHTYFSVCTWFGYLAYFYFLYKLPSQFDVLGYRSRWSSCPMRTLVLKIFRLWGCLWTGHTVLPGSYNTSTDATIFFLTALGYSLRESTHMQRPKQCETKAITWPLKAPLLYRTLCGLHREEINEFSQPLHSSCHQQQLASYSLIFISVPLHDGRCRISDLWWNKK